MENVSVRTVNDTRCVYRCRMLELGRCVRTVNDTRCVYRCIKLALGLLIILDVSKDVEC